MGSGVGGAVLAYELAHKGLNVIVLEAGTYHKLGTERRALSFYSHSDTFNPSEKSLEGTQLLRTIMVGGSSIVTIGNGVRALEHELKVNHIDLTTEFDEAEAELNIQPTPRDAMGPRTSALMHAADELGYSVEPMPKYVNFNKCRQCGNCHLGCIYGAKWTALRHLTQARKVGAKLSFSTTVQDVQHKNNETVGVRVSTAQGRSEIKAQTIILAAGGLGTPVILQKSGLAAGNGLFADLFLNTYGLVKNVHFRDELGMATLIDLQDKQGLILSPFIDSPLDMFFYLPLLKKWNSRRRHRLLGLMTKITDDQVGTVAVNGAIQKPITRDDSTRLDEGKQLSSEILISAGADPKSLFTGPVRGEHPGGTAAIGTVVDANLETEVSRLFVCDASVLPQTPGKPPALTLIALAKRLANILVTEYM